MDKLQASKKENLLLKDKLLHLDTYIRRENLKFSGISEAQNESAAECKKKLLEIFADKLGIEHCDQIQFQRCHRLGPKPTSPGTSRDIIARFLWFGDRQQVWNKRSNLRGTTIVMREDFPSEIEDSRSRLYPFFKAAKDLNKKASLVANKLYIENQLYTVDTLDKLPQELQPGTLAVRESDTAVLFYGRDAVFSNFHPCNYTLGGQTYCTVEQYFQQQMAIKCGDLDSATAIMNTTDPLAQLRIGRKVRKDDRLRRWSNDVAQQVMETAVTAKFQQCDSLKQRLLATGGKMLVECNKYDKYWGVGLSLHDDNALVRANWKGENTLGNILVAVREALK